MIFAITLIRKTQPKNRVFPDERLLFLLRVALVGRLFVSCYDEEIHV